MRLEEETIIDANMLSLEHRAKGGVFQERGPQIATDLFAGLFKEASGEYALWYGPSWESFAAKWSELANAGLLLVDIDTFQSSGNTWFIGVWQQSSEGYSLFRTPDWNTFYQFYQQNVNSLRLVDIDISVSGFTRWYTGVWLGAPVNQQLLHELTWDTFVAQWNDLSQNQGYRLTKIQAYHYEGTSRFTGVFEAGDGEYALLRTADWNEFIDYYRQNENALGLVDFIVFDEGDTRSYIGVWRETGKKHEFVYGLDWGSFVAKWDGLSDQGYRLRTIEQYPNYIPPSEPQWDKVFKDALGTTAEGYAYVVSRYGQVVSSGVFNDTRSPFEAQNPDQTWEISTQVNLASVSKPISAVAVLKLLEQKGLSVDEKFYPFIANKVPSFGQGVDTVTIRNLLTMKSGMVPDGSLKGSLWPFLNEYLAQALVGTPGVTYKYSNTNFTILQGLISELSGQDYVTYATQNVLIPMGIAPSLFNPQPDPPDVATLYYSGQSDQRPGMYWHEFSFVAPGGWITSAKELIKFLIGLRNNAVLSKEATDAMLTGSLGWYPYSGVYGIYYHHNGGLKNGLDPHQEVNTGIVRFTDGYDAVLLINSTRQQIIKLMVEAFETR
jgi:CubicO group peptidase (beta-lactamase class C family)